MSYNIQKMPITSINWMAFIRNSFLRNNKYIKLDVHRYNCSIAVQSQSLLRNILKKKINIHSTRLKNGQSYLSSSSCYNSW